MSLGPELLASLRFFTPELTLAVGSLVILFLDFVWKDKKWLGALSLLVLAAALSGVFWLAEPARIFSGLFLLDGPGTFFKILILFATALPLVSAISADVIPKNQKGEFYVLMIAIALFLITLASTTNLLMIFLAMESVSITSYILAGFQKFGKRSSEASLKYLLFGSVASATMLFGMSLLFGITQTLELNAMSLVIANGGLPILKGVLVSLLFIFAGLGFKMSLAPFHMWAPDVYEGAPTPVTAFLTVAPKSVGFLVFFRILAVVFPFFLYPGWTPMLVLISIATMTIGNLLAVSQTNVKRLLAYSSIAQAGFMLMGLATMNETGVQALFIYFVTYLFTNLGAFLTVAAVEQSEKRNGLDAYNGLAKRKPILAFSLAVFLLSLAGIPPLAGFIAKWYVFASAIEGNFIGLAVAAALNSAVAAYYYFKIIKAMYLTPSETEVPLTVNGFLFSPILVTLVFTILIGLFPSPLIGLVQRVLLIF